MDLISKKGNVIVQKYFTWSKITHIKYNIQELIFGNKATLVRNWQQLISFSHL